MFYFIVWHRYRSRVDLLELYHFHVAGTRLCLPHRPNANQIERERERMNEKIKVISGSI